MPRFRTRNYERIFITAPMRQALRSEARRTGLTPRALLLRLTVYPRRLKASMIQCWLDGMVAEAPADLWCFAVKAWALVPTPEARRGHVLPGQHRSGRPRHDPDHPRIPFGEAERSKLLALLDASEMAISKLIEVAQPLPDGLTARVIYGWKQGASDSARRDHWEHVVATLGRIAKARRRKRSTISGQK